MILSLAASLLLATAGTTPACSHADMAHHHTMAGPTNTICPVLGNPVTSGKSALVKVRGHEYFICCADCQAKLKAHPSKYLAKDGTPLNAMKPSNHPMGGMKM
jgi:YHS domain-containing protein